MPTPRIVPRAPNIMPMIMPSISSDTNLMLFPGKPYAQNSPIPSDPGLPLISPAINTFIMIIFEHSINGRMFCKRISSRFLSRLYELVYAYYYLDLSKSKNSGRHNFF